jgi:hypothetical protein
MKATLEVLYEDGTTVEAQFSTVDLVKFEAAHNRSATTIFDERRVGDLTWLAWHALRRKAKTEAEYDDWLELVDTITFGKSEEMLPLEMPASTGK